MAAKAGFLLARCQLRVSEDWVVGTTGIEPVTPYRVKLAQLEQLTASFRVSTGSGLSRIKGLGWAEG
jgi:hypothetical protein